LATRLKPGRSARAKTRAPRRIEPERVIDLDAPAPEAQTALAPPAIQHAYRLSMVLPAFNEEGAIATVLEKCTAAAERLCADHEIIVVDDGSSDGTAAIVEAASVADRRIRLVRHESNKGYGEALRTGFLTATMDLVFFTDADNQFDLNELEKFLPWINHVDVVAGYRIERKDPFMRRTNAVLWNLLVRALFYVPVRDIDCAFKLFRREVLQDVHIESVGAMVNTELMVRIARRGHTVVEIGVSHFPRTTGKPTGANPRVILRAFREVKRMYRRLSSIEIGPPPVPPS